MPEHTNDIKGLTSEQVLNAREKCGYNRMDYKKENAVLRAVISMAKEPMIILLLVAASIYFISGKTADGIFLTLAIVLIATISLYQEKRSRNALEKLKTFTQPNCKVIRNGKTVEISSEEIVVGDFLVAEEGALISADATIVHSGDFAVDESILTGESMAVSKDKTTDDTTIYSGTHVVSGMAIAVVTAIGMETKLGKIGKSLENITEEKTPLEIQINAFVKKMVILGGIVFSVVWAINYFKTYNFSDSLLKSLAIAMSILPEEIPVAFTSFMALGAWRLMKMGIVVKQMKTIETLGSATVICVDKTGTITKNEMSLVKLFVLKENKIVDYDITNPTDSIELITTAMWASEPAPFDPMEIALHGAYVKLMKDDERIEFKMTKEYALGGKPPMMTHIFENRAGDRIIAAKGAPEALMQVSNLSESEKTQIETALNALAQEGYRILGVGKAVQNGNDYPESQEEFKFAFIGLVAFYDPPKDNIKSVLQNFYNAGISVKMITGDNDATACAIAKQIEFKGNDKSISGNELMLLSEEELKIRVMDTHIFTRMFPDAKLKIINALKAQNQIVAMTGDGVNDGPALKASHIGIAMGKKGSEIAKQSASLILVEDDLSKMVDAVAMGRRIYTNLKKAIQYIISIHIPIILIVFIPLALGWVYPNLFSPIHIIFLELIMGPTCSIIYENEPIEKNTMLRLPRPFATTFFSWKELTTSIIQGLAITAGCLLVYQYASHQLYDEHLTRTMVFTTLLSANIFLTLVNRSFYYSVFTTLKYKNNLVLLIIAGTIVFSALLLTVPVLIDFFDFSKLTILQLCISVVSGFASVIWYEFVKLMKFKVRKSKV